MNIFDIQNKAKKDMLDYSQEKKIEMEMVKMDMFAKKQTIMNNNTERLWELKQKFLDDAHNKQINKMELYYKIKNNRATTEDFK
jgi:hypothetical protein